MEGRGEVSRPYKKRCCGNYYWYMLCLWLAGAGAMAGPAGVSKEVIQLACSRASPSSDVESAAKCNKADQSEAHWIIREKPSLNE